MGNGIDDKDKGRYSNFTIIPIERTYTRDHVSRIRGKKTWDYWEVRGLCDSHESIRLAYEELRQRAGVLEQDVVSFTTALILMQRGYALGNAESVPVETVNQARKAALDMIEAIQQAASGGTRV